MADFFPQFTPTWHNATYSALSASNPSVSATNKTVLITGGGRGIGSEIASSFATAGAAHIILLGRSKPHLLSVKQKLESASSKSTIHIFTADITDAEAIDATFATVRDTIGPIDILVNNAAYLPDVVPTVSSSVQEWWRGFEVNVLGTFLVTRAFLKSAAARSVLVNVSTAISHIPAIPGGSSYGASKAAGVRFMEFVAAENPTVSVVNLHPGSVETDMNNKSGIKLPMDDGELLPLYPQVFVVIRRTSSNHDSLFLRLVVKLPADFVVWVTSPEAEFLKDRYVWVNWDVEELKGMKEEILKGDLLKMTLKGWPAT